MTLRQLLILLALAAALFGPSLLVDPPRPDPRCNMATDEETCAILISHMMLARP